MADPLVCNQKCECRLDKDKKKMPVREYDPTFVSCATSPATARAVCIKRDPSHKYHSIKVSCPFCGHFHRHGGGEVEKPIYYGSRVAHCHKGTYTIIPPN